VPRYGSITAKCSVENEAISAKWSSPFDIKPYAGFVLITAGYYHKINTLQYYFSRGSIYYLEVSK